MSIGLLRFFARPKSQSPKVPKIKPHKSVHPLKSKDEEEFKYDPKDEMIQSLAAENEKLKDQLAVKKMAGTAEEKEQAAATIAELRERIRVLEAELDAIKVTRNSYQTENGQLKKQIAAMQRQAKK